MDDFNQIAQTVRIQEDMLRFDHFTARDAWDLGAYITTYVFKQDLDMAISIRKLNGHILFQHCTHGTTISNQNWMQRKFNTVALTEGASLRAWATLNLKGQTPQDQGLNPLDYAFCGGGFPIRLKTGELIGAVIVSNLPHRDDHRFVVDCLARYLGIDGVPYI